MDREDWLYFVGAIFLSLGAWRAFGEGYGLLMCGAALILPPLLTLFIAIRRKGPDGK